jgi:hypothetical protein
MTDHSLVDFVIHTPISLLNPRGFYHHFNCKGCLECRIIGTVKEIREYVSHGKMICQKLRNCKKNISGTDVHNVIFDENLQDANVQNAEFLFGNGWLLKFNDIHVHIVREISFQV